MKDTYTFRLVIVYNPQEPRYRIPEEIKGLAIPPRWEVERMARKLQDIVSKGYGWLSTMELQTLATILKVARTVKDPEVASFLGVDLALYSKVARLWEEVKKLVYEKKVQIVRHVYVYPDRAIPASDQEIAKIFREVGLNLPASSAVVSEAHMGLKTRELYKRWKQEQEKRIKIQPVEEKPPTPVPSPTSIPSIERRESRPGLGLLFLLALLGERHG